MPPDQQAVTAPQYQLPPQPPSRERRTAWIVLLGIVVLVLALIGGAIAAVIYYPPANVFASAAFLPKELAGATFLSDTESGTVAYVAQGFSFTPAPLAGTLVSASPKRTETIIRTAARKFIVGIGNREALATTTPALGVTTNGTAFVIALPLPGHTPGPETVAPGSVLSVITIDGTAWHLVYSKDLPTGRLRIDGPTGTSPLFITDSVVTYFSPAGLGAWDTRTGSTTQLVSGAFRNAPINVLQSPDHTLVGFRDATKKTIVIYRVTPQKAELVATLPITTLAVSYTLGNDAVYALRHSSFGSQVWKQGFTEPSMHRIAFLPKSLMISRISIGSL